MTHLFIGTVAAPFEGEETTSLLRIVDAALAEQLQVTVWACRGATLLSQQDLGETRVRNLLELGGERSDHEYPTTAALIGGLFTRADGRLRWFVCSHCLQERGAVRQIPSVKVISPLKYFSTMKTADVSLVLGAR
jgi:hypothetical protein